MSKEIKLLKEKVELFNEVYEFNLVQKKDEKYKLVGSIRRTKDANSDRIVWDIKKYDVLTITVSDTTPENCKKAKKMAQELSKHIISKETGRNSNFIKYYNECRSNNKIEKDDVKMNNELAITKEMPKTMPPKVDVSEVVKNFMRTFGTTKLVETLELAVAKYNDAQDDIALLEDRAFELNKEDIRLKQKIERLLYENEQLTKSNEEAVTIIPEDPDDDPNGGQSIPAIDYADLKAELKAEILAELREELKASLPTPVKVTTKEEVVEKTTTQKLNTGIKLPKPVETIEKKEIVKEEIVEKPKTKKLSELTYEDISNMDYQKLQKLGSAIKLGSGNVANKDELIKRIAAKLKLTAPASAEVAVESLNILKTASKLNNTRAANISYVEEDIDNVDDDFNFNEEIIEEEVDVVAQLEGKTFEDPARQKLAALILSRKK